MNDYSNKREPSIAKFHMSEEVFNKLIKEIYLLIDLANIKVNNDVNPLFQRDMNTNIESLPNDFQINLFLREAISAKLNGSYLNYNVDFWVVQKWGGITQFKDNRDNRTRINNLAQNGIHSSACVSSLSKIASFVEPQNSFVYDSRVAFILDYLLLKCGEEHEFFPLIQPRNAKIKKVNLRKKILNSHPDASFISWNQAYDDYCILIKQISDRILGEDAPHPCIIEMLLFTAAPIVASSIVAPETVIPGSVIQIEGNLFDKAILSTNMVDAILANMWQGRDIVLTDYLNDPLAGVTCVKNVYNTEKTFNTIKNRIFEYLDLLSAKNLHKVATCSMYFTRNDNSSTTTKERRKMFLELLQEWNETRNRNGLDIILFY